MSHVVTIPVGVIVARERIDHPWQDYRWRPVAVFLDPPACQRWVEVARGATYVHYHAATLEIELHRKETTSYQVNLANGAPSVYVVLCEGDGSESQPMRVHLATVSPFEAQAYDGSGFEIVERVPMPEPLIAEVQRFISEHHVAEAFTKRQRQRHHVEDEHKFGQEPLVALRQRMDLWRQAKAGSKS